VIKDSPPFHLFFLLHRPNLVRATITSEESEKLRVLPVRPVIRQLLCSFSFLPKRYIAACQDQTSLRGTRRLHQGGLGFGSPAPGGAAIFPPLFLSPPFFFLPFFSSSRSKTAVLRRSEYDVLRRSYGGYHGGAPGRPASDPPLLFPFFSPAPFLGPTSRRWRSHAADSTLARENDSFLFLLNLGRSRRSGFPDRRVDR